MVRIFIYFLLIFFSHLKLSRADSCRDFVDVMKENLLENIIRYFRATDSTFSEKEMSKYSKASSPSTFMKMRFGHKTSAADFMKFVLTLSYVDSPTPTIDVDLLRESIYEHINNKRVDEAREGLGKLILLENNLYLNEGNNITSVDERCMNWKTKIATFNTLGYELSSVRRETSKQLFENFIGLPVISTEERVSEDYFNILIANKKIKSRISKRSLHQSSSTFKRNFVVLTSRDYEEDFVKTPVIRFDVDPTLTSVLVEANKYCGTIIVITNNKIKHPLKRFGDKLTLDIDVDKQYGEWKIKGKNGVKKGCKVQVSAFSSLGFFLTSLTPSAKGRGYQVLHTNPSPNLSLGFLINFYGFKQTGGFFVERVRFINMEGSEVIKSLKVNDKMISQDGSRLKFFIKMDSTMNKPFRITIEGLNEEGFSFTRTLPRLITISKFVMDYDKDLFNVQSGKTSTIPISVTNHGSEDVIQMDVFDDFHFSSLKPKSKRLKQNETFTFDLLLDIPFGTAPGSMSNAVILGRSKRSHKSSTSPPIIDPEVVVVEKPTLKINSMKINSIINFRFAETNIETSVTNNMTSLQEASIDVLLPLDAFVTNLTMKLGDDLMIGKVEEKVKADTLYEKAKEVGVTAGRVASRKMSPRNFRQSLLIAPGETVIFTVTYQQLLNRLDYAYDYSVVVSPNQPVPILVVDIHIVDENPLTYVRVVEMSEIDFVHDVDDISDIPPKDTTITFTEDRKSCRVTYSPTLDMQTDMSPLGLNGAFTVLYDVSGDNPFGSFSVNNGYFAHFFAARALPVLPKAVIYIMDISGSMSGTKEHQAKEVLQQLINQLNEQDYFNVVLFESVSYSWEEELQPATKKNKEIAISFINSRAHAGGGTNIVKGYDLAFDILDEYTGKTAEELEDMDVEQLEEFNERKNKLSMHWKIMCFLTDGHHNGDGKSASEVAEFVTQRNKGRAHIFNVALGDYADFELVTQVSAQNKGLSRRIFENIDAVVAIKDFFFEVSNILMSDIKVEYDSSKVESISKSNFDLITKGKELIISGKLTNDVSSMDFYNEKSKDFVIEGKVIGRDSQAEVVIEFEIDPHKTSRFQTVNENFKIKDLTERIWAYMRIKELLQKAIKASDVEEKEIFNAEALKLSLRYNFVTPLTSIIVLKQDERQKLIEAIEETTTQSPVTTTTAAPFSPIIYAMNYGLSTLPPLVYRTPSYYVYGGGAYSDPHIVLPIKDQIDLCFNLDGYDNEVHNLIYDPKSGLVVNGLIIQPPDGAESPVGKPRLYIHSLSFIIPEYQTNIFVTPFNITVEYYGIDSFTIPLNTPTSFSRSGVTLYIYEIIGKIVKVEIEITGVRFELMLHPGSHLPRLDLAFGNLDNGLNNERLDGVIGQFYGRDVHLKHLKKEGKAILRIGERQGDVIRYEMQANPITGRHDPCWLSVNGARDLSKGIRSRFIVNSLTAIPDYEHFDNTSSVEDDKDPLKAGLSPLSSSLKY